MKTILVMGCLLLPGLLCTYGQANQVADTVVNDLEVIVVSANRWEQHVDAVPHAVRQVNAALVQLQNPQTAADMLGISDHVFIQKSQLGGGSPMIRGFATNRVLIAVDGVRMNNAIFRSGNVQNVISLDPNAVSETEVLFGPGAVTYGSDAIGGVMEFRTLPPTFSQGAEPDIGGHLLTRYSSANNERTAHVDVSLGFRKWAFVTSVTRSGFDDLRMGSHGPGEYLRPDFVIRRNGSDHVVVNSDPQQQVSSGYDQWNAMQKIAFKPNEWTSIGYGFHYSATSDYPRYDRLILREDNALANAEWYYGPQEWMMHALDVQHSRPTKIFDKAKVVAAMQDFRESRHNRGFGSTRRTNRTENVRAFSANADLEKELNSSLVLFYGAEFVINEVKSRAFRQEIVTGEVTPTSTRYPDGADWKSTAGYVSLKFAPSGPWIFHTSARYTSVFTAARFDNTFFDFQFAGTEVRNKALTGSIGVVFNPLPGWKLYSNLSKGFRAPNVDDIGKVFDSEPGNVVVPNPGLEPEVAYGAELGVVGTAGSNVKVDLAGYYTLLDNAIARGTTTFNGEDSIVYDGTLSRVLAQQNIGGVWVAGLQASVEWEITERIKATADLNYQKGREKDPESGRSFAPTHIAPAFGSAHVIYQVKKIRADLYANYNGAIEFDGLALSERADRHLYAIDGNGNPYSPAWSTVNFKIAWAVHRYLEVTGGVENIFDRRYRPYSSGISAPGRNFIIALRANL